MPNTKESNPGSTIAVIGAGAGGLAFAVHLKRRLGFEDFIIYEKASDVGGTWRDNIYPGCSSDVPVEFYSLSTDHHNWARSHASQEEFLDYLRGVASKHTVFSHIRFQQKVTNAEWNPDSQTYTITLEDTLTGDRKVTHAKILISAIGVLEVPRFADIPGLSNFKGKIFHSARWEKDVDLRSKNVGVIGNGASAAQFVPLITEDPTVQVTQFCRTPNWYSPPARTVHSYFRRSIFRLLPFLHRLERYRLFVRYEFIYLTVFATAYFRNMIIRRSKDYILSAAPKEYHSHLIPNFPLGCKRIIRDTNYLTALYRPNLSMNWEGIESIAENGIVTKTGTKIPLDVLIFSTGYAADFYPLPVRGVAQTIQEHFKVDGPKAYLGTTVPGFPNFFTIFGPNTATGHTSVIYTNEVQACYIIQLIKPILENKVSSIEVKEAASKAYNAKINARLAKSVHINCHSWYRIGGDGRISNIFPGSSSLFWFWLRKPNWDHYTGVGLSNWKRERRRKTLFRYSISMAVIVLGAHLIRGSFGSPYFGFNLCTM